MNFVVLDQILLCLDVDQKDLLCYIWRMSLIQYTNFKEFLKENYELKLKKNPAYSLRAFARDLGVSATQLNRFFRDERGFSFSAAEKILNKFPMAALQKKFLLCSVSFEFARSEEERNRAQVELKKVESSHCKLLKEDEFAVMKDWYHSAIVALMGLPNFKFDLEWIASQLGIHVELAASAIGRMIALGILKKTDQGIEEVKSIYFESTKNPEMMRTFHQQVLEQAQVALHQQSNAERYGNSFFFSVQESQFEESKAFLAEFAFAFAKRFSLDVPKENRNALYGMSLQLFKVNATDAAGSEVTEVKRAL